MPAIATKLKTQTSQKGKPNSPLKTRHKEKRRLALENKLPLNSIKKIKIPKNLSFFHLPK